jgi:hypothetical protein
MGLTDHFRQRESLFITVQADGQLPEKTMHGIAYSFQESVVPLSERGKAKDSLHNPVHTAGPLPLPMGTV